jgi:hypothetical protein
VRRGAAPRRDLSARRPATRRPPLRDLPPPLLLPQDPFYHAKETLAGHHAKFKLSRWAGFGMRRRFMAKIRAWWAARGGARGDFTPADTIPMGPSADLYDPIIYTSSAKAAAIGAVQPTQPAMFYDGDPAVIVHRPASPPALIPALPAAAAAAPGAITMIVFQGQTGVLPPPFFLNVSYPGTTSPLGIILARRHSSGGGYDVHIAFRGSRSGSAGQAVIDATTLGPYTGNADWTTDMDMGVEPFFSKDVTTANDNYLFAHRVPLLAKVYRATARVLGFTLKTVGATLRAVGGALAAGSGGVSIAASTPGDVASILAACVGCTGPKYSSVPLVHRGFNSAMKNTFPTVIAALNALHVHMGAAPAKIWVSGHSLGGALAVQFVARILLDDTYPADDMFRARAGMSDPVSQWPWATATKLVTFSAPAVGNVAFGRLLTAKLPNPPSPDSNEDRWPNIAPGSPASVRLHGAATPVHFRVLNEKDPITQDHVGHCEQFGTTVFVSKRSVAPIGGPDWHEPSLVRDNIAGKVGDSLPAQVANFQSMVRAPVCGRITAKAYTDMFGGRDAPAAYTREFAGGTARTAKIDSLNLAADYEYTGRMPMIGGDHAAVSKLPFQPDGAPLKTTWSSDAFFRAGSKKSYLEVGCSHDIRVLAWRRGPEATDEVRGFGLRPEIVECDAKQNACVNSRDGEYEPCVCIRLSDVSHIGGSDDAAPVTTGTLWLRRKGAATDSAGFRSLLKKVIDGVQCRAPEAPLPPP